jgi:hypothetical protein
MRNVRRKKRGELLLKLHRRHKVFIALLPEKPMGRRGIVRGL